MSNSIWIIIVSIKPFCPVLNQLDRIISLQNIEVDIDKARLEVRLHGCASKIVQTSNRETMRGGEGELTLIIARQNIEIDRVTPPSRLLNKAVAYQTMHRLGKPQ